MGSRLLLLSRRNHREMTPFRHIKRNCSLSLLSVCKIDLQFIFLAEVPMLRLMRLGWQWDRLGKNRRIPHVLPIAHQINPSNPV